MADRTGVLAVYAEIRERWQTRGLDCWTDDPTSSGGDGWLCVAELDADPERLDERLGAFSDRVETAQPKAAASLLGKRFRSLIPFPATVT